VLAYNGYFVVNNFVLLFKILLVLVSYFVLSNSVGYIREHQRHHLEYAVVFLLSVLLMLLLIGSNHIFISFLALVGFSLNLYVLIMFDPSYAGAREAGIKYYFLSTFSSGLLLYGLFLLYTATQTGRYDLIAAALSSASAEFENSGALQFATLFILLGLFFKLSAFPGHL
jgi:NADH-quinone oxidoreductase subunit N